MPEESLTLCIFVGLLLAGFAVRMALEFAYGARGPKHNDIRYGLGVLISWVLILLSISPLLIVSLFSIVGFIPAVIFVEAVLARRRAMQNINCTMLSLTAGQGAGFDPTVVRVGAEDRGIVGEATRRLIGSLETGAPLSQAIARNPDALPREALAFAVAGESIGAEAAALEELAKPADLGFDSLWRNCIDRTLYLGLVLLAMLPIGVFMMIEIIPEFRKIFYEFDLSIPQMTEIAIGISDLFGPALFIGVAVLLLAIIAILILYLLGIPVLQPLADRLCRASRVASALRIFAITAEHNKPLAPVIERLAAIYPVRTIGRALQRASFEITAGKDWRDALLRAKLIRCADHALLGTAQEVGNLPWALRLVADRGQRRLAHRTNVFVQVVFPLLIVAIGTVVGFFVVAMFVPLVSLVEALVS